MAIKNATTTDDIVEDKPAPAEKSVKVKSPQGAVTEVPESIVDKLIESGYTKK